jgi:hypothetical protein
VRREVQRPLAPLVPPAGFEPAHLAPEASALSPELRGRPSAAQTFGSPDLSRRIEVPTRHGPGSRRSSSSVPSGGAWQQWQRSRFARDRTGSAASGRIPANPRFQRTGATGCERSPTDRTQEVAGSSPASSMTRGPASWLLNPANWLFFEVTIGTPTRADLLAVYESSGAIDGTVLYVRSARSGEVLPAVRRRRRPEEQLDCASGHDLDFGLPDFSGGVGHPKDERVALVAKSRTRSSETPLRNIGDSG